MDGLMIDILGVPRGEQRRYWWLGAAYYAEQQSNGEWALRSEFGGLTRYLSSEELDAWERINMATRLQ